MQTVMTTCVGVEKAGGLDMHQARWKCRGSHPCSCRLHVPRKCRYACMSTIGQLVPVEKLSGLTRECRPAPRRVGRSLSGVNDQYSQYRFPVPLSVSERNFKKTRKKEKKAGRKPCPSNTRRSSRCRRSSRTSWGIWRARFCANNPKTSINSVSV